MIKKSSILQKFKLDHYSAILFLLVSISIPYGELYKLTIPLIAILSCIQVFRVLKKKLSPLALVENYFYLIIFSTIFHKSVHNELLVIFLLILSVLFLRKKTKPLKRRYFSELLVSGFFLLIFLNHILFANFLNGLDTYLYLLFYPVLFFFLKQFPESIKPLNSIRVYIVAIVIATIILIVLNVFDGNISIKTNTYFSKYLGLTHVYYGMFVGLAAAFLFYLEVNKLRFISAVLDKILLFLLLITLVLIGSRIALIAVFLTFILVLFVKIRLKWYAKSAILLIIISVMFMASYLLVPRAKDDLKYVKKVYTSIKSNNKEDIVHNSWRNMYQRYLVLKYTKNEIKLNPIMGIGLVNVRDQVSGKIHADGYIHFQPINTHNQYLHFLLGLGLIGFLFFLWILGHFYKGLKGNQLGLIFIVFFIVVMMTESILVRAKGISLFFLFAFILSIKEQYEKNV